MKIFNIFLMCSLFTFSALSFAQAATPDLTLKANSQNQDIKLVKNCESWDPRGCRN